ncbi:DUF2335 domain-containing protein [Achromobacter insolitus]|uniref:DUF2335 domain-containing protein n=1 Tax=Achromobacter insolitus TaxID=217204 RepID=UPI001582A14D|nr:DUF2335 domain-containing protein [Achromobacter insolitus]
MRRNEAKPIMASALQHQAYEGPIPPPALLEHYNEIVPGAAERIIAMAESETAHRRQMESMQVNADVHWRQQYVQIEHDRLAGVFRSDALGQKLGALVSCIALIAAAVTATIGVILTVDPTFWAIPIACVSLPVMGMVQAVTAKKDQPTAMDQQTKRPE